MCMTSMMFSFILSEICNTTSEELVKNELSQNAFKELFELANKHDVAHIVASALSKADLLGNDDLSVAFKNALRLSIYRDAQREYVIQQITQVLEQSKIPYIPLKGSVIRQYYPETWMRTSCDIDILVHESDSEKARAVLVDKYGYVYHGKGSHDISLFSPTNIHIELHYDLVEDEIANASSDVLKNVWAVSTVRAGYAFLYEMPDEMFYFYHIAHMAKHFENGGCGIRPFIDLWILDGIPDADVDKRDKLLQDGNLLKFANSARKLSRIWFAGEPYDFIAQQMEEYILQGGVYGNNANRIVVQQQKKNGKIRYALSKIFLPYSKLKFHYPILQKHRWLTPFMEVRRWFKLVFCGHAKRTLNELKYNQTISPEKANATKKFLEDIGL